MASGQPNWPKMVEKLVAQCDQLWWDKEFRVACFGFNTAIPLLATFARILSVVSSGLHRNLAPCRS